jgi:hypothetical protein
MPLSAANTEARLDDTAVGPTQTHQRRIVHATLIFDGVDFDPSNLYDALNASWGTVATEKDEMARGCYIFHITA